MTDREGSGRKTLGSLLVEEAVITEAQLQEALEIQKNNGGLLGQVLVTLGYSTEEDIVVALTAQYGFPYLPLKNYRIDASLAKLVPEELARKYKIVPVDRIGDTLTVSTSDPLDRAAIKEVADISGCTIQVFVSTTSDVMAAIEECYRKG